jgi:hypothetical protein
MDKRVYADETAIWDNEAPKKVRAPRGRKVYRTKLWYGNGWTLHVYAKRDCVLYWELRDANANDAEVKKVALQALKKVEEGDILIWGRLGRAGRSKAPQAQHFNPKLPNVA